MPQASLALLGRPGQAARVCSRNKAEEGWKQSKNLRTLRSATKYDGTTAPLFTPTSPPPQFGAQAASSAAKPQHRTHVSGGENTIRESRGRDLSGTIPHWGWDALASLMPVCCPDATRHLSDAGSPAGQAAGGLYLATATKQAAESADWRQGSLMHRLVLDSTYSVPKTGRERDAGSQGS